jgi:hypothetical protein
MKERFAKLLLGDDMSGGAKGVCTALAISNAITNLSGISSLNGNTAIRNLSQHFFLHSNSSDCADHLHLEMLRCANYKRMTPGPLFDKWSAAHAHWSWHASP